MKVVYRSIANRIRRAVETAGDTGNQIERVELTIQEAEQLYDDVYSTACLTRPYKPVWLKEGCGTYLGVTITWTKT